MLSQFQRRLDEVVFDFNQILQLKRTNTEAKEKVNFLNLVSEICQSLNGSMEKDKIKVVTDFTSVEEILTIKSYLKTIFDNLISNCIKFRKKDQKTVIKIKSKKKENKTVLIFSDNGIGIDLDRFGNKIFGLYYRCHTEIEGKGMGLYLVKSQVETLEGKISVKSKVNKGTEFTIEFAN